MKTPSDYINKVREHAESVQDMETYAALVNVCALAEQAVARGVGSKPIPNLLGSDYQTKKEKENEE